MPDRNTICYYAMYVIGEVESRHDWTAINYNDPITVGMMQWYGVRAAELLLRCKTEMPDSWPTLAESLRNELDAYGTSSYWNGRYLTTAEGETIVALFSDQANHILQENQAIADFEGYINILTSWGLSEDNPKTLIFAMSMYHQGPLYAGQVVSSCGNADLDTIWRTCLNNGVLGQYTNRYNEVHEMLASWDGESMPPDFGQVGGGSTGGSGTQNPGTQRPESEISYIQQNGDQLIIYGPNTYKDGLICYPVPGSKWVPAKNANGVAGGGDPGGGGTTPAPEAAERAYQWLVDHLHQWSYGNGAGRLNPEQSGYTDCSGGFWCAYYYGAGVDIGGNWTGTQATIGREIWRGTSWQDIPWDQTRRGDLLLLAGPAGYNFGVYSADAQMLTGEPNKTIGCGYGPLPRFFEGAAMDVYGGGSQSWMIRRVVE